MLLLARTSVVECWSLSTIGQLPDASVALLDLETHPCIYPLPGCILAHTSTGVYILDPITLIPMPCKMLQARDSDPSSDDDDSIPRPQFDIANCTLTVLNVFDINWSSSRCKQNTHNNTAVSSQSDCSCVAMAINYRLIVMKITRR